MSNLKRTVLVLSLLILAALVVFFTLENQQAVGLVMLGWAAPPVPVAVLVLTALVLGMAIGPLLVISRRLLCSRRL